MVVKSLFPITLCNTEIYLFWEVGCGWHSALINYILHLTLSVHWTFVLIFAITKKPNDQLLYVNTSSDHPPQVIKQLPNSINWKIIKNSSNKAVFDASKNEYEEALLKSGYKSNLEFQKEISCERKSRRRRRNISFNPPFSQTVKTTGVRLLLCLLDKHFPRSHILRKLFNWNSIKVSYSCMENVAHIIKKHNQRISSCKESQNHRAIAKIRTNIQ